jgi:hypothetical protein
VKIWTARFLLLRGVLRRMAEGGGGSGLPESTKTLGTEPTKKRIVNLKILISNISLLTIVNSLVKILFQTFKKQEGN